MTQNVTESIAQPNRNIEVQEFFMGLDFAQTVTGLRLSTGSYIVAQIPKSLQFSWDWSNWAYNKIGGKILNIIDRIINFHFNYIIIGIKKGEV